MPARYAVTAAQWLLTAVFGGLCGVARPFPLDEVVDVGFCLLTGRPRPLSRATFQDVLKGLPASGMVAFYQATARAEVQASGAGEQRYSVDGHGVPRWTKGVDLPKTKLHTVGQPVKADQLFFVYHLDRERNVALQVGTGGTRLSQVVVGVIRLVQGLRQGLEGALRFFCDRGAYQGQVFQWAQEEEGVHLYVPAVRYENNVAQWEQLGAEDFEKEPFVLERERDLPAAEQKRYRYAETRTTLVVDGDPEGLPLDVPERLVDAAQGAGEDRPAAVEGVAVHGLPVVDHAPRVLADQVGLELLDRRGAGEGAALEDRLAEPHDPRVGVHLQEEVARLHQEGLELGDRELLARADGRGGRGPRRGGLGQGQRAGAEGSQDPLEQVSSTHVGHRSASRKNARTSSR